MKAGVWFYGVGTVLTGILNIVWGAFDASHQPIQSLGKNLPGQHILAIVAGFWLIAAGVAILRQRSAGIGSAASLIIYLIFAALWLPRYYVGIHLLGWRMDVLIGVTFHFGQQILLASPAVILFMYAASSDSKLRKRALVATRWMLGLPPIVFGLGHLTNIRIFATFVPHWIRFGAGDFWAAFAGVAFTLAGVAICSAIMDVLAARLLAFMLLLFEFIVEAPPLFGHQLQSHEQWAAAVYNLTAIGACLVFASFVADRAEWKQTDSSVELAPSTPGPIAA